MRRRILRVALLVTLALLGLSEGRMLMRSLEEAGRQRDALAEQARRVLERAHPQVEAALARAGAAEAARSLRRMVPLALAGEAEVLDSGGRTLASFPVPAPVAHSPSAEQWRQIDGGAVLVVGPLAGPSAGQARLLSYMRLRCCPERVRLASPAEGLVQVLHEQRGAMATQIVRLTVLLLAALLALLPQRSEESRAPAGGALLAYQEAMARLKAGRDDELQRHEHDLQRMQEAQRDLESMARAGELTAGVVHEVRNALAAILGNARLLEGRAAGPDPRELAGEIRRECESLEVVVRRFVEFARRESLSPEPFDARRLLERVVHRETSGHALSVTLAHEGTAEFRGDEALLERAFENLVRNAREAAGPGGWLEVRSTRSATLWRVEIANGGAPLPPELIAGARPFFTKKPGGLGLGLALATKIVRLHAGALSLRAPDQGGALVIVEMTLE